MLPSIRALVRVPGGPWPEPEYGLLIRRPPESRFRHQGNRLSENSRARWIYGATDQVSGF